MILHCDTSIQLHILSFLSHSLIASCESVCSHFKHLVLSSNYWQRICEKHVNYKLLISKKKRDDDWKDYYHTLTSIKGYPYAVERLQRELKDIQDLNISGGPINHDWFHWTVTILGDQGTLYEGGKFELEVVFPYEYPLQPMKIVFVTPILHCNINSRNGSMSLNTLLCLKWDASFTLNHILRWVKEFLSDPNPDDPLEPKLAALYITNRNAYNERVKAHVQQFATS